MPLSRQYNEGTTLLQSMDKIVKSACEKNKTKKNETKREKTKTSREKNAILNPFLGHCIFVCLLFFFFRSVCPNDRKVILVADYIFYSRLPLFWIK